MYQNGANAITRYPKIFFYLIGGVFVLSVISFVVEELKYFQYLLTILVVFSLIERRTKHGALGKAFVWFFLLFVLLIVRGVFLSNYLKYLYYDIYAWSWCSFLLFFSNRQSLDCYRSKIPELFAKLLIFSIPFTMIVLMVYGNFSSDIYDRSLVSGDLNSKIIYYPILFSPLLMPFIFDFNKKLRFIVVLGNLCVLAFGVMSATRGVVVVPLLAFLIPLFQLRKGVVVKRLFGFVLFSVVIFLVWNSLSPDLNVVASRKFDYLLSRSDIYSGHFTSYRDTELQGLFSEFSLWEFVFGRGAGGSQRFGFWRDILPANHPGTPLTHFGFLHLILKGGFLLLISVYGLALWSVVNLYRRGDRRYLFVIILYMTYEVSITKFNDPVYLIFLFLSLGYSLKLYDHGVFLDDDGKCIQ